MRNIIYYVIKCSDIMYASFEKSNVIAYVKDAGLNDTCIEKVHIWNDMRSHVFVTRNGFRKTFTDLVVVLDEDDINDEIVFEEGICDNKYPFGDRDIE